MVPTAAVELYYTFPQRYKSRGVALIVTEGLFSARPSD